MDANGILSMFIIKKGINLNTYDQQATHELTVSFAMFANTERQLMNMRNLKMKKLAGDLTTKNKSFVDLYSKKI